MNEDKMDYVDFIKLSITKLGRQDSKGIHSVFSGFNEAFREYYNEDPVQVTRMLAQEGKIELQFRRGGAMIYLPGEGPPKRNPLDKVFS